MKIFVAGASGALGRRLVPLLVEHGYEVVAMTRSPEKERSLRQARRGAGRRGRARPGRGDESRAAKRAGGRHPPDDRAERRDEPEATSTNSSRSPTACAPRAPITCSRPRKPSGRRASSPRASATGTTSAGATRSKTRGGPARPRPAGRPCAQSLAAIRHLETAVLAAGDRRLALRYGNLYGPGTGSPPTARSCRQVRKRRLPIVGDGAGVWSFVHVDDAAAATLAAIERGAPGVYNVADDEPVAVADWLPELAHALGAKPPRRVPVWLGRLAAGEPGVSMLTQIRGAVEREGQARARVAAALPELARRLPRRPRVSPRPAPRRREEHDDRPAQGRGRRRRLRRPAGGAAARARAGRASRSSTGATSTSSSRSPTRWRPARCRPARSPIRCARSSSATATCGCCWPRSPASTSTRAVHLTPGARRRRADRSAVRHADRRRRLELLVLRPRRVARARARGEVARERARDARAHPQRVRGGRAGDRRRAPRGPG